MSRYVVQITERWDFEIEADSEAEAKAEAEGLREFGLNKWANPGDPTVYDVGTKVVKAR